MDPNSLKVTELKSELTARGLSTKGLKKELVTRLEEALESEGTLTTGRDVAPKSNEPMDHEDESIIEEEAEEIAKVVEPVQEAKAAAAEFDVVMAAVPEPVGTASSSGDILSTVSATATTVLEPVVGTPKLSQEGLIDTTGAASSTATTATDSKKRQLEADDITTTTSERKDHTKRLRHDSEEHARIRAAATEAVGADALRRSAAPSPSPAPGRSASTASISTVASSSLTPGPPSPTEDRKSAPRKIDARLLMERQIKMAIHDRKTEGASSSSALESKPAAALATVDEDASEDTTTTSALTPISGEATRSLVITNFVRPLTVNQVKRLLAEFGEVEVLWMDNIRTHCYVTYKTTEEAQKAYREVVGQVFPKETGKPLKALFLTPEDAAECVEAAEQAQKTGKRPIIYTGKAEAVPPPKRGAAITVRKEEVDVIFKHKAETARIVKPTDLFKMTTAQPPLYYKAVKEPPVLATSQEQDTH